MSDTSPEQDLLIDFVLGRCSQEEDRQLRARLAGDKGLAAECESLRLIFAALGKLPAEDPPTDLAERTLERVRAARRTESLLLAQRGSRRKFAPVFALRDLVALAAVAVLAVGVVVPTLRQARRQADVAMCANNMGQIGVGLAQFANRNADSLPAAPSADEVWLPSPGHQFASNTAGLFQLVRGGLTAPGAFQCPAAGGANFAVAATMNDFPSPRTIDYSYQHSLSAPVRRTGEVAEVAGQFAILSDATPLFVDGKFRPDRISHAVSDNHPQGVQNVLYLDMHVQRATDCRVGVKGNNIWLAEGIYVYAGNERPTSATDSFLLPAPGR